MSAARYWGAAGPGRLAGCCDRGSASVRRRALCAGRHRRVRRARVRAEVSGLAQLRSCTTLQEKFGYPDDHVKVLAEEGDGSAKATRENVRAAFADLRKRAVDGDVTLVLLIGHGTADSDEAKFNLVGPDLTVDEWAALVKPMAGPRGVRQRLERQLPVPGRLAGRGRVVVTPTTLRRSSSRPCFRSSSSRPSPTTDADRDKNGKVSLLEAFTYASAHVKDSFEQKGQLATERPLLDDTGDGVGREVGHAGPRRARWRRSPICSRTSRRAWPAIPSLRR